MPRATTIAPALTFEARARINATPCGCMHRAIVTAMAMLSIVCVCVCVCVCV